MRDKQDRIVAELAKVGVDGVSLDDALEALDTFAHYERSHDHLTASYDEVWEHPMVSQANEGKKGAAVLGSYFFTLYALKAEHEVRDWRPAFKFIFGRIGNTTVLNIN